MPPTPSESTTPSKRRRDPNRGNANRRHLMAGSDCSAMTSPSSSRTSTPARSRNATPHHNRRGRRSAASLSMPVHLDAQIIIQPALLHNTPPPPYEFCPDSPFHILVQQINLEKATEGKNLPFHNKDYEYDLKDPILMRNCLMFYLESETQMSVTTDCGCPGACSCLTIIRRMSLDSMTPLIETRASSCEVPTPTDEDNNSKFPLYEEARKKLVPVEKHLNLTSCRSEESVVKKPLFNEEEKKLRPRNLVPLKFRSLDGATPLLGQLKKRAWNRSM